MSRVSITVLVDQPHQGQISKVVAALQAAGMTVDHWMETIGVVTGSVDSSQMAAIAAVTGVAAVEPAQTYQLDPPPDVQ
jgi:hypothetical protein